MKARTEISLALRGSHHPAYKSAHLSGVQDVRVGGDLHLLLAAANTRVREEERVSSLVSDGAVNGKKDINNDKKQGSGAKVRHQKNIYLRASFSIMRGCDSENESHSSSSCCNNKNCRSPRTDATPLGTIMHMGAGKHRCGKWAGALNSSPMWEPTHQHTAPARTHLGVFR
eukprot:scaffold215072_cov18-Tisochrysis_lutea.AAC.1